MGANEKIRRITDLHLSDFEQIDQEWWQDYSEDLPESDEDYQPVCKRCGGRGCDWCYMLDPVRI